jgi:DNA-binding MarR family transcriptional regulator
VSSRLAAEIRQKKPFALLEEEAALNLVRTHEFLEQRQTDFFKRFQLTPTQYNILRILRGAGKAGVTCSQAAERMVAADPDITRLLDRLEARQLIERQRGSQDRRVVISRITTQGTALLKEIDRPLADFHKAQLGPIGKERLTQLIEILESIREA